MDWIMTEDKWFTFGWWLKLMFLEIIFFFFLSFCYPSLSLMLSICLSFVLTFCLFFTNDCVVSWIFFPLNLFRPKWLMVLRITFILLHFKCEHILQMFPFAHIHGIHFDEEIFFVCLLYYKFDINFPWRTENCNVCLCEWALHFVWWWWYEQFLT